MTVLVSSVACGDPPAAAPEEEPAEARPPSKEAAPEEEPAQAPPTTPGRDEVALQRSILFEQQGQLELAASAAEDAIAMGGGRGAQLQAAKIAILRERWDEAESKLRPILEADPNDADAHYDLALVAHRRGRYNDARSGYLAALRARKDHPDARYNLALLTWERNVRQEAQHHVERFVEAWPDDPRVAELRAMVGAAVPEARP